MDYYTSSSDFFHGGREYREGQGPLTFAPYVAAKLMAKRLIRPYEPPREVAPAATVFCIASGPSLTVEDCERVRAYREREGVAVIAVNLSYKRAPWADYLYAMDRQWWKQYGADAAREFPGRKIAPHVIDGAELRTIVAGNSGAGAIMLAAEMGARRIVLLGYDGAHTGGFAHWHEDYPKGMGNAGSVKKWPGQFAAVLKALPPGVEVINASRASALTLWPMLPLEEVAPL
jgi:hypothetical protein